MDGGESGGVEADAERQGHDSDDGKKRAFQVMTVRTGPDLQNFYQKNLMMFIRLFY